MQQAPQPYSEAVLDASALVQEMQTSGIAVRFGEFIQMERERQAATSATLFLPSHNARLLVDPFEYLLSLD